MVELVVAERSNVVMQAVHQLDDRLAGSGNLVDESVAGPTVARVDEQNQIGRIAACLDGGGQQRETLDFGVHVVGREDDERPLARSASRREKEDREKNRTEEMSHICSIVVNIGLRWPKLRNNFYLYML